MMSFIPLTNDEADWLLSEPDWQLEEFLATLPTRDQDAILSQLERHKNPEERVREDPAEFRRKLLIDCDGLPKRLASVAEDWQEKDFAALDPGWRRAVRATGDGCNLAYLERGKGHSKTTDTAAMVAWALFAAGQKINGITGSGTRDQAKLLRDAIDTMARLNPWLELRINNYEVKNWKTGSQLTILSADEHSAQGPVPDFVVVDELTHHRDNGLYEALFAGWGKRTNCMLVVMSNAGYGMGTSWQWKVREMFRTNPACYFSRLDGPQASWVTKEKLDLQRAGLTPKAFARLWLNLWQVESGEGLDMAAVEACCTLDGPMNAAELGWEYVGGLDLGVTHDHSAAVVLACRPSEAIRLANCKSWKPGGPQRQVDLQDVERTVLQWHDRYRMAGWYYDPHQAELMSQRLRSQGVHMVPVTFGGRSSNEMAMAMAGSFAARSLLLYREPELLADLQRLSIEEGQLGMLKLTAISDENGHADRAIALSAALPGAVRFCRELAAGIGGEP